MKRSIAVVTGSRADYGLLRPVIRGLFASDDLEVSLIVTGMHLSPEFGLTLSEIEADGFPIYRKIETQISSDTPAAVAKSTGLGIIGFADLIGTLNPDIMVVLGDRYEILAAVTACLFHLVPVAHISGGEVTSGAFDDSIRHAISKMSHIHFVSEFEYQQRLVQLGESPSFVFNVGSLGAQIATNSPAIGRADLEARLGMRLGSFNLLVTFHPTTLSKTNTLEELQELLDALSGLSQATILFTAPNADPEGRRVREKIEAYCAQNEKAFFRDSLGSDLYLACVAQFDLVIGNSSSGVTEAPAIGTPSINIGDRQTGRIKPPGVTDVRPNKDEILRTIQVLKRIKIETPAPSSNDLLIPSELIVRVLSTQDLRGLVRKSFHDMSWE